MACFYLFGFSVVPPNIVGDLTMPENVSVVEKNPITLICETSGIPHPSVTWLKYGQPVSLNPSVRILSGKGEQECYMTNQVQECGKAPVKPERGS